MPHVVTSNCKGCKYTDCVTVCPVDCFHEGPDMLYIDPDECIDCGACESECPVQAIFEDGEVPEAEQAYIALNAEMVKQFPVLTDQKEPLPGADDRKRELGH